MESNINNHNSTALVFQTEAFQVLCAILIDVEFLVLEYCHYIYIDLIIFIEIKYI